MAVPISLAVPFVIRRRWRDYRTAAGRRPVREFIAALSDHDAAQIVAANAGHP